MCGLNWVCYVNFFNYNFGQQLVANLIATFIGVALGIPVALWLSSYQQKIEEKERKKKILHLITEELLQNFGTLSRYRNIQNPLEKTIHLHVFLKTENWRAFSDGGELQWIKDPNTLGKIAEAYNFIRMVLALSERYVEMLRFPVDSQPGIRNALILLLDEGVNNCMFEISQTLKTIEEAKNLH